MEKASFPAMAAVLNSKSKRTSSTFVLWLVSSALLGAPLLMFARKSTWAGPAWLGMVLFLLWLTFKRFPLASARGAPQTEKACNRVSRLLQALLVVSVYLLTLFLFYHRVDTWETWTWLMHSREPYVHSLFDEREADPPLVEIVNNKSLGHWRGPHITHGLLQSTPMLWALRFLVGPTTPRFAVNDVLRGVNALCCLGLIPFLFWGLREANILKNIEVPMLSALLSPGVFMVGSKGHWLGISYGLACLGVFFFIKFIHAGRVAYLIAFALIWTLIQGFYTGALFFLMICGLMLMGYVLMVERRRVYYWRSGCALGCALGLLCVVVGGPPVEGIRAHFRGNGETLFEIEQNRLELNRFAGYWAESAEKYGLRRWDALPLFYRAGLGMIERNLRNLGANFGGTGSFRSLWFEPNNGEIKSFGFVLPWFLSIGVLILVLQKQWQILFRQLLALGGGVFIFFGLLLFTWDMSAHRVFSINLLLAGGAGVIYDHAFSRHKLVGTLELQHVLSAALGLQAILLLWAESSIAF